MFEIKTKLHIMFRNVNIKLRVRNLYTPHMATDGHDIFFKTISSSIKLSELLVLINVRKYKSFLEL